MTRFLLSVTLLLVGMTFCIISLATEVELTAIGGACTVWGIVLSSRKTES